MSTDITGPPTSTPADIAKWTARKIVQQVTQSEPQVNKTLFHIMLTIAGALVLVVLSIFGWVAVHVMNQQDTLTLQYAEQARHIAAVEAKLDILLSDRHVK